MYAKSKLRFSIPFSLIPPVIPPPQRKHEINTEDQKQSIYLKDAEEGRNGW